ncbi:MAG TPA: DUF4389 domain-containing protein, partial [Acidimicrobiales bacterium]|nr:DUF4389 domain-containing protein [Acidimicrobiales bacterium]
MAAPIDRPYVQAGFGTPGPQNRWTVFFRLILLVPQFFVAFAYGVAAFVLVVLGWFAALVTGRMPASFAGFLASFIQYYTRLTAYLYLMHDAYPPFSLNPARDYPVNLEIGIAPVRRLAVLFRIILLVPAFIVFNVVISGVQVAAFFIWLIVLVAGRMPVSLFEAESAVLRYGARYNAYAMMLTGKYPGELYGDVAGVTTLAPPWPPPTAPPPSTPLGTPVPPMPEAWLPPTTTPSPAPQEPAGEPGPTGSSWPPPAVPAAAVPPPAAALPPAAPAWPSAPLPPPM